MAYLIVEMSEAENWPSAPWCAAKRIPARRMPTMLQPDLETARREALRLAGLHPDRMFVVFARVEAAITVKVPTHVTLSGQVFAERKVQAITEIGEPDDIPF